MTQTTDEMALDEKTNRFLKLKCLACESIVSLNPKINAIKAIEGVFDSEANKSAGEIALIKSKLLDEEIKLNKLSKDELLNKKAK